MNDLVSQAQQLVTPAPIMTTDAARAVEEVRVSITIAKKFPRDEFEAEKNILQACERLGLAEKSMYDFTRGGVKVTGPSIHLAKVLARYWGNLQYGIREIESNEDETTVQVYCWDMQTNTRIEKMLIIKHEMKARGTMKKISDPDEIYNHVANRAARRLRASILDVIPIDIQEKAVKRCTETLEKGDNVPIIDRVKAMIVAFSKVGVSKEMIEARLKHKAEIVTAVELVSLHKIYTSIKDGEPRERFFTLDVDKQEVAEQKEELNKLLAAQETKTE